MADSEKDFINDERSFADEVDELVRAQVATIREHPELVWRYDVTGDGMIDEAEWNLVERMVRLEVETRLRAPLDLSLDLDPVAERFEIVGMLGRGGQGVTHLAIDQQTGDHVVVKELSLRGVEDWKAVELFEREGAVLESISHPRIPSYIDSFTVETPRGHRFFLVQEYVFGDDLEAHVRRDRWDAKEAMQRLREAAEILEFLHQQAPPVIHRDIKPSNFIVAEQTGALHLVDFGAAQSIVAGTQGGSTVVGTSGYVPLEQYAGRATPASDVYALGATVLHCVTGLAPIDLPMQKGKLDFASYVRDDQLRSLLDEMLEPFVEDRIADGGALLKRVDVVSASPRSGKDNVRSADSQSAALVLDTRETEAARRDGTLVETRKFTDTARPWLVAQYESDTRVLKRRLAPTGESNYGMVIQIESQPRRVKLNYSTLKSTATIPLFAGMAFIAPMIPIMLGAGLWGPLLASTFMLATLGFVWQSSSRELKLSDTSVQLSAREELPIDAVYKVTVTDDSIGFHHGDGRLAWAPLPTMRSDVGRYLETVMNDTVRKLQSGEAIDPSDVW